MTAGWRRETSYPAYGRVLFCDCRMAKRLIRPTGEYCFVTAGWRREASYPAYGRVLFVGRISASAIRHFL
ncbi:hypothetical protein AR741_23345 [Salmonella enterica subsp. enterica serovar Norwich]|nr:hypothetical protein [Salmonella enterica]EBW0153684.1 hypothetical protein [Salmonella enterica subsp. enterica serovar Norwich]EBW0204727.1 hypothetical protein [Salmonella enterica subsp. enterica serovar Senftenberg]EAB3096897.1 hypothetical protein [Salmonella enterica]EAB4629220.1 hypothetical protein [Salmonella enterica]